jgi:hypothetical protein
MAQHWARLHARCDGPATAQTGGPREMMTLQKSPRAFRYQYNYDTHYSYRHRFCNKTPELSWLHHGMVPTVPVLVDAALADTVLSRRPVEGPRGASTRPMLTYRPMRNGGRLFGNWRRTRAAPPCRRTNHSGGGGVSASQSNYQPNLQVFKHSSLRWFL